MSSQIHLKEERSNKVLKEFLNNCYFMQQEAPQTGILNNGNNDFLSIRHHEMQDCRNNRFTPKQIYTSFPQRNIG